jgi:hypothetical protein
MTAALPTLDKLKPNPHWAKLPLFNCTGRECRGGKKNSEMNVRPHPGPLPQEREKRPPRVGATDALGRRSIFRERLNQAAIATVTPKLSCDAPTLSLSPGEKAGVRASVNTNFPPRCQ